MNRLSLNTKKNVLTLFLNTAVKRILEEKAKKIDNPCYECLRSYLDSNVPFNPTTSIETPTLVQTLLE